MPFDGSNYNETIQQLRDARARATTGWCQRYTSERYSVCSLGALAGAGGPAVRRFARAIGREKRQLNHTKWAVAAWNDEFGRTQAEVLAAFDEAIEQEMAHAT